MTIAITPEVLGLARAGAWFVFSVSGGKDSGAALHAGCAWLDAVGHPRDRRVALHADLGRAEWPETLGVVRDVAAHVGVRCETTSQEHDLVWRFEDRWRRCLLRYAALETISLPTPWSSSSSLFCRSEQKSSRLSRYKAALPGDLPVVGVTGLRRAESHRRSQIAACGPDNDMIARNRRQGLLWNPIADWTTEQVFAYHADNGIPLHPAYARSSSRLSCAFCVLGSRNDIAVSLASGSNDETYQAYVSLEMRSAFSFQPAAWLADLRGPVPIDRQDVAAAKAVADERRRHQATLPPSLLKARTVRNIAREDAMALARVRRAIGDLYGITPVGTDVDGILELAGEAA